VDHVARAAKSAALVSVGCRTNQEEISALTAELRAKGFFIVDDAADADVVIINTCSVTSLTESKTGRLIRSLSREAPDARILVTGCFAQQHGESILEYPGVEWVVGNGDKHKIPSIIMGSAGGAYLSDINNNNVFVRDDSLPGPEGSGRTRFSLKIQEGCDFKCAYCVVPSLRGPSRSAPVGQLTDTFKRAVDKGYKEIVLTGTHIGQYNGVSQYGNNNVNQSGNITTAININPSGDENHPVNLESILEQFLKIPGDYRVRLSSLDPRDLTDALIYAAGEDPRVCAHLHVSVQSLSAGVLSLMNRPYADLDLLIDRLRGFREKYPRSGLGADFIVGHPGETDAMFAETLRVVEAVGFTYGHVFRYSKRRGTAAASMPGQVAESVKKSRSGALRGVLQKNRKNFLSLLFGSPLCIIVESENPARGVSGNYIRVEVPGVSARRNAWMRVALTGDSRGGICLADSVVSGPGGGSGRGF